MFWRLEYWPSATLIGNILRWLLRRAFRARRKKQQQQRASRAKWQRSQSQTGLPTAAQNNCDWRAPFSNQLDRRAGWHPLQVSPPARRRASVTGALRWHDDDDERRATERRPHSASCAGCWLLLLLQLARARRRPRKSQPTRRLSAIACLGGRDERTGWPTRLGSGERVLAHCARRLFRHASAACGAPLCKRRFCLHFCRRRRRCRFQRCHK